jgi:D-alanyl-lipoteichoic acid acyltransferase DltB (MBOAT superfamily)
MQRISDKQSVYLKEHKEELTKEQKKEFKDKQKKKRLLTFVLCLLVNLGILATVKYANFFIENVNSVTSVFGSGKGLSFVNIAVPLGISFYTFQSIGYLLDVYREAYKPEKNVFKYALFVSFFPQIVQGPIGRYGEMSKTLYSPHPFDSKAVGYGLERVLWGYFKKMVIADRVFVALGTMIADSSKYNGAYSVIIMLMYTLQLYADFTGGIDITIGLSEAMGIRLSENFDRPYFSKSLKEYWRRWHISMCSWFRDYLFYPVSVSKPMQKLTKFTKKCFGDKAGKRIPLYLSTAIVWFATGIWHGASWNFIVWGMCNWAILMISEELEPLYAAFHKKFKLSEKFLYRIFMMIRTFAIVCVLNLFDCYSSIGKTAKVFFSTFTATNWHILWDGSLLKLGLGYLDYAIIAFGIILMLTVSLLQNKGSVREMISRRPYPVRFLIYYGLFLIILLMGAYGIGYDASQFIYNQF